MKIAKSWGWSAAWDARLAEWHDGAERGDDAADVRVGRVVGGAHEIFRLAIGDDEFCFAKPPGKARAEARWPAVGDWVLFVPGASASGESSVDSDGTILHVLARETSLQRRKAGKTPKAQVLATNVDFVFVVGNPNEDFSLSRLDRYVALAREGGAEPVVVLNKIDLIDDVAAWRARIEAHLPGLAVVATSARTGAGEAELRALLAPGKTGVFVGSSGVGKSSLVNRLAEREILETQDIREGDDKGRHTTTARELHRLPWGALLVDTPGLREVGLLGGEGVSLHFADVETLAARCKFTDCRHENEPHCAVRRAIEAGELSPTRLESFLQLNAEAEWMRAQEQGSAESQERKRHAKVMSKGLRVRLRQKGRR